MRLLLTVVLLNLLLLTFSVVQSQEQQQQCSKEDGVTIECKDPQLQQTKVVKVVRGRLGNHIWGYFYNIGLQTRFPHLEPLLTEESTTLLTRYFQNVRFRAVTEATCGFNEYYSEFLAYVEARVLAWFEKKLQRKVELVRGKDGRLVVPPELAKIYPVSTNTLIAESDFATNFHPKYEAACTHRWRMYVAPMEEFDQLQMDGDYLHIYPGNTVGNQNILYKAEGVAETLLNDLRFKDAFIEHAQTKLRQVKAEIEDKHAKKEKKKKMKKMKEVMFVGVHWRMTDHLQYEERFGQRPVSTVYFLDAMHMYRRKFGKSHNLAFIFVSDDMEAGREKLAMRNKEGDLYFAGVGKGEDPDAIGQDLALLSNCNHTILSHGTYSYFAGVFSGGLKVIPEHFKEYRSGLTSPLLDLDPLENPLPRLYLADDHTSDN